MTQLTKKHDHAALEKLYLEADTIDKEMFAEQRSNLLLIAGEHYQRRQANLFRRIRDSKDLNDEIKIRLTKNHIQNICKNLTNNILSAAPGVGVEPKDDKELQDQKCADLAHSVWRDGVEKYGIDEMKDDWADEMVGIGEVATKVFWDPNAGVIKHFEQAVDGEGQPMFDADGVPQKGDPKYTGGFVLESIYGFNLLRAPEAKEMKKSPYLIVRKMVDKDSLLAKWGDDPTKAKMVEEGVDETMTVFDGTKATYAKAENQVLVKEFYFRPCPLYPNGFFYMATKVGILAEGELPGGIYPIIFQHYDKVPTSPRGRSPIKTMRPYQIEINRAASKMAEHQITLGDDKLLIQNGTKVSPGVALPGVRAINYSGMQPGILAGRDGSQYLAYMQGQIAELYSVMNVSLDTTEKTGQFDAWSMLFRAGAQKKNFSRYIARFERFLKEVCRVYLELAKIHLPDDAMISAVGSKEQVNIPEFKNTKELSYEIKLEAQSDDLETKFGKQIVLNHILQYTGSQLGKEDIGKMIRAMPYSSSEESFSDLTIDYDSGTNFVLAMDRGERPPLHPNDDFVYLGKRLAARMRQADFQFKTPEIQSNYQQASAALQQQEAQRLQAIQQAEAGFIPTSGYMVTVDLYVSDPNDPLKTRRARIPYDSIQWLIKKLEAQGQGLQQLEHMDQGSQAGIAQKMAQNGQPPNGMGGGQQPGAGMPGGAGNGHPGNSGQQPPGGPSPSGPNPAAGAQSGGYPAQSGGYG